MRPCFCAAAAFALLGAPVPAQAANPPPALAPSSPWVVNYAEDSCRLVRMFGEGEQQVRLEFRMFAPEKSFWVLASGKPFASAPIGVVQISSRFDPDDKDTEESALRGQLNETTPAIMFPASFETAAARHAASEAYKKDLDAYLRDVNSFDTGREAQVDALAIKIKGGASVTLKIGAMHAPMDAVRTCLDNLLASWGVDPKTQKSLTRPPWPASSPAEWLKSDDYPEEMLAQNISDIVNFRLTVDAAGVPTACNVLTMESRPEFIKASCDNLMKHARFKPALDANGKPVPSIYVDSVRFESE